MAEHDLDHRLGQSTKAAKTASRVRFRSPRELQVMDGGERVEADGDGCEQPQDGGASAGRVVQDLELAGTVTDAEDQHAEPQPIARSVFIDGPGPP